MLVKRFLHAPAGVETVSAFSWPRLGPLGGPNWITDQQVTRQMYRVALLAPGGDAGRFYVGFAYRDHSDIRGFIPHSVASGCMVSLRGGDDIYCTRLQEAHLEGDTALWWVKERDGNSPWGNYYVQSSFVASLVSDAIDGFVEPLLDAAIDGRLREEVRADALNRMCKTYRRNYGAPVYFPEEGKVDEIVRFIRRYLV